MDMNSLISTLLSSDSVSGVSKATKTSSKDVQSVLSAALPALLNGAKAQSEDKSTAESFAKALLSHGKDDTSNLSSFLKNVDLEDGSKIISHLLGSDDSVKKIAKKSGVDAKETGDILSAAAPLLMSLLGQESASKKSNGSAALEIAGAVLKNVDVGDLLGDLLGGGDSKKKSTSKKKDNDTAELIGGIIGSLLK